MLEAVEVAHYALGVQRGMRVESYADRRYGHEGREPQPWDGFAPSIVCVLQEQPCQHAPNSLNSRASSDAERYASGDPSPSMASITSASAPGGTGGSRKWSLLRGQSCGSGKGASDGTAYTNAF